MKEAINSEDVKRWYQILIGKSEQAMLEDINNTLRSQPSTSLPSDEDELMKLIFGDKYLQIVGVRYDSPSQYNDITGGVKLAINYFKPIIAELEKELREVKEFTEQVMSFADGMKVLDGDALLVLKKTARRVLSDKPTSLPRTSAE